jgi:uncharacterized membrane protein
MREGGFVTPAVLVVLLAGIVMAMLAIDVARYASAARQAAYLADVAAESGAAMIDPDHAYRNRLILDQDAAADVVSAVVGEHRSVVDIRPRRVCVTVITRIEPLLLHLVGARSKRIEASACASPAQG